MINKEEICCENCDKCEYGTPIDGQFYDDGSPICECGLPRDLTDWELERFIAHGHPITDCEQKCDKCPEWMANICNNYDYYEKKYKKGDTEE